MPASAIFRCSADILVQSWLEHENEQHARKNMGQKLRLVEIVTSLEDLHNLASEKGWIRRPEPVTWKLFASLPR